MKLRNGFVSNSSSSSYIISIPNIQNLSKEEIKSNFEKIIIDNYDEIDNIEYDNEREYVKKLLENGYKEIEKGNNIIEFEIDSEETPDEVMKNFIKVFQIKILNL